MGQAQRRPVLLGKHKCEQPPFRPRSGKHRFRKFGWRDA